MATVVIKEKKSKKDTDQKGQNLSFLIELQNLINRHNKENDSDTPDFILAQYMNNCLTNFNLAQQQRSDWYSG